MIFIVNIGHSSTQIEDQFKRDLLSLNEDLKQEILYGDLSLLSQGTSFKKKLKMVKASATQFKGRKFAQMVKKSFSHTIRGLKELQKSYHSILDMTFNNGLSGREMIVAALDPDNNKKILDIYSQKKAWLQSLGQTTNLHEKALDLTLVEIDDDEDFNFLKIEASQNYVLNDPVFSFLKDKCTPAFGEEDFFLLLFGFNRCTTQKYRIDRYTVGLGYLNAPNGFSYVTGLKIGKKGFMGIGARVQIGVNYAGGIGVFLGNGLIFSLDLERAYGLYAGATYFRLKPR
jgi:hypothetical protein